MVIGELPKLTGTSADGDSAWRELGSWVRGLGDIDGTTLLVGAAALAGILVLRFVAPAIPGAVRAIANGDGRLRSIVLDLAGVNFIDSQGAAALAEVHATTEADGIVLRLAKVRPQVLRVLVADGVVARIGADRVHATIRQAVDAQGLEGRPAEAL